MNNTEEIQHFIDVLLKEDSFVKAAKKLYISQPYLTQLIKRIEDRLGTPIIDRDKKPYALTQAGLLYYQYLENISLQEGLKSLTDEEYKLINLRYFEDKTQSEIAQFFGTNQVQISRNEKKILKKLKNNLCKPL